MPQIGPYEFQPSDILGKGATGIVYRGTCLHYPGVHITTGAPVAVKVIDATYASSPVSRSLLESEKRALRALSGPNTLRVFDIIEQNGECLIITELCEGGSLKDLIRCRGMLCPT